MFSSCYLFFVIVLYPVFLRFHFRCRPMGNVAVRVTWSWSMPLDWNDGTVCIFGKTKKTFVVSLVPKPFLFSFAPLRSSRETGMERRFGTPRDAANASWKRIKICFFSFVLFFFFNVLCFNLFTVPCTRFLFLVAPWMGRRRRCCCCCCCCASPYSVLARSKSSRAAISWSAPPLHLTFVWPSLQRSPVERSFDFRFIFRPT